MKKISNVTFCDFEVNKPSRAGRLNPAERQEVMKYIVYLVEDSTGNEYEKGEFNCHFDAEVYIDQHKYSCPKDCHYKIHPVYND